MITKYQFQIDSEKYPSLIFSVSCNKEALEILHKKILEAIKEIKLEEMKLNDKR